VRIYPATDAYFNSPILQALADRFGAANVRFSRRGFPSIDNRNFAFVVEPWNLKVCYSNLDAPKIKQREIEWCDVYAKANYIAEEVPADAAHKVVVAGPQVPVRLCGPAQAIARALWTLILCASDPKRVQSVRTHFANWWRQYKYRLPEPEYGPGPCSPDYAFYSSSLWKDEPQTNTFRAHFMEACQSVEGLRFEGGFMPRPRNDMPGFERFTVPQHWTHRQFVANTKRSVVAFNTPSVFGCNPWRTAEFTCMGKAIISTPLHRPLPAPWEHGRHAHFVEGSVGSIREAIQLIRKEADYRAHLERNARAYFDEHLAARRVLERILQFGFQREQSRTSQAHSFTSLRTPDSVKSTWPHSRARGAVLPLPSTGRGPG
jgi:hypothetical protein